MSLVKRPSYRIWRTGKASLAARPSYRWYSRSHCLQRIPTRTAVRESVRLVNQKMFTRSADGVGAKGGSKLGGGRSALADAFS
jgi:hypothetical protein